LVQARAGQLPFPPEIVGSHWSKGVQVDLAALNWQEKAILLGECKWGTSKVRRDVVRELIETKTPKVLKNLPEGGEGWSVHYVFFARAGFTNAACAEVETVGAHWWTWRGWTRTCGRGRQGCKCASLQVAR